MTDRMRLAVLRDKVAKTKKKTEAAHATKLKKKAARKSIPDFDLELTNGGQRPKKAVNSTEVKLWFREGLEELYGGKLTIPPDKVWWTVKEKNVANRLLEAYGEELVKKTVAYFCEHWMKIVSRSRGRISGRPDIKLLWAMRERIFADAELGVVPEQGKKLSRDSDEYEEGKPIGIGWG